MESQSLFLSKYRLEAPCLNNGKKFTALESVSVTLKIAALLLLIFLWRFFYIAIIVWIISIAVGFFKRNLIYKYVYEVDGNNLTVYKEYNAEKRVICERLDLKNDIINVTIGEADLKYYETTDDIAVTITKKDGNKFSVAADAYFYALINYGKGQ